MFSFIPPVTQFNTDTLSNSMIKTYKLFHSVASNESYRSVGEQRKDQLQCIFHYTLKGSGEVIYKGKAYRTKPGTGFFNIINEEGSGYGYPEGEKEPWEFIVVSFLGGNVREIVKELLENNVLYDLADENSFCVMCKRLLEELGSNMKLSFFQRLISMIHDAGSLKTGLSSSFEKIVERDLLKNPTISAIAQELNISREHLQREYYRENLVTPAKHLSHKRFEKLCYLLTTDKSETEIAEIMSFPSLPGMTMFFKKFTGITPRQYRQNGYIYI